MLSDYLSTDYLSSVLDVSSDRYNAFIKALRAAKLVRKDGLVYQPSLYKKQDGKPIWAQLKKSFSDSPALPATSYDEYELLMHLHIVFPQAEIQLQVPVKLPSAAWNGGSQRTVKVDFKISQGIHILFVEFEGMGHFYPCWGSMPEDSTLRRDALQQATGCEVVDWPYWIPRIADNVRCLFDPEAIGYGAVWGAKYLFGDFPFDDSARIIKDLSTRFKALRPEGVGYFYAATKSPVEKPEHPLAAKLRQQPADVMLRKRFIPKGGESDSMFWLPSLL